MTNSKLKLLAIVLTLVGMLSPQLALACATCGCSEVCPIAMMEANNTGDKGKSLLTESIWGNIILKMAYTRDPQIQKLARRLGYANLGTANSIAAIAGGTMAQNIVSMAVLNPPDGIEDSYTPGAIGLGLDGATNIAFTGRILLGYTYRKKINARKRVVRERVETILEHLEFSKSDCPEAQRDLTEIIGERAAKDCIQLWQSSHVVAEAIPAPGAPSIAPGEGSQSNSSGKSPADRAEAPRGALNQAGDTVETALSNP